MVICFMMASSQVSFCMTSLMVSMLSLPAAPQIQVPPQ